MCLYNLYRKGILLFFLSLVLSFSVQALPFSFQLATPVLNVDSLERWLEKNPGVTSDRLTNLIKVERSYAWVNKHRAGRYLPELMKLDSIGYGSSFKASVFYIKAVQEYLQNQHAVAFKSIMESFDLFKELKDQNGVFYASCLLLQLRFDKSGDNLLIGSNFEDVYLSNVRKVLKNNKDIHAIIQAKKSLFVYQNSLDPNRDGLAMENESKDIYKLIENNPIIAYAQYTIQMFISLSYHYQGRFIDSYRSNLVGLQSLAVEQKEERMNTLYNLSVDCLNLGRFKASWELNQEVLNLLYSNGSSHFSIYEGVYSNLMFLAGKLGLNDKIAEFADSSVYFIKRDIEQKQANTLLALEQLYEKEKKELKIKELETQKKEYLFAFVIVALFILIIIFLTFKVYRANKSLKNLINLRDDFIRTLAHDLRRPMHAFVGLSDVFSRLLRKGDTQSINRIAQSIDLSGLAVRQTLDNLLYWAMDQKEALVVKLEPIRISNQIESIKALFVGVMSLNNQVLTLICLHDLDVVTDPNALSLILRNILDNATKYTPPNGEIRIEVTSQLNGVYIEIQDSGPGMDPSQIEAIQLLLSNPKKSRPNVMSQGLGLVLVALFAQKLNIKIILESSSDHGTKYVIGPFESIPSS